MTSLQQLEPARREWTPLLTGRWRKRALELAEQIGRTIARAPPHRMTSASLGGGTAGLLLLHAYLARALPGRGFEEAARAMLRRTHELVDTQPMAAGLYAGLAGVGWVIEHLQPEAAANQALDQRLSALLQTAPWKGDYDLINGLAGMGVYALERSSARTLDSIVQRLKERAEESEQGITWYRSPRFILSKEAQQIAPFGFYDLGLAHGVPGVIVFLERAAHLGIDDADHLLEGAQRWLLSQDGSSAAPFRFACRLGPWQSRSGRDAWCYGDLSVAASLLRLDTDFATQLAKAAADRATIPDDAHLCHGTAGIALLYLRFHQATGDRTFEAAAVRWLRRTIVSPLPDDHTFLEGQAGIALTLLAAATPIEPQWDRAMLLSA